MYNFQLQPWERIPLSFHFSYFNVRFLNSEGYIDSYTFDYGSFTPLNETVFKSKIPFLASQRKAELMSLLHRSLIRGFYG